MQTCIHMSSHVSDKYRHIHVLSTGGHAFVYFTLRYCRVSLFQAQGILKQV